ncbi:MAG: hypothetical protein KKA81_10460 [Bacteroidetes bacterium]|nr:hypothetical protein [Bacteroidota bacterium]
MKTRIILLLSLFIAGTLMGQQNWNKVDFEKEYKRKVKIGGAAAKSLKNNKTFISNYAVSQATTMTGSNTSSTKAVYSEVSLGGLTNESYLQMTNELYEEFVKELTAAGLQITDGTDVLASEFVQEKMSKDKGSDFIGSTGDQPYYEGKKKITDGAIPGYTAWAVTRDITFRPANKNIYYTSNIIKSGNFYQKLSTREDVNLLDVNYFVAFASFEGSRGYKDIKLSTQPVMSVGVQIKLITPNGSGNWITYSKGIWGNADWSEGIVKGKDNKNASEALGLARSAEYDIAANPEKYVEELKAIIINLQKDIVKGIREEL